MNDFSLQHFETFLSVAEHSSFTRAAGHLGVSKAAVSQTIRLLEDGLKAPLFIRTTRRMRLTEEGEQLLVQCQKLKVELDIARGLVAGFADSPSGVLRISANPYFASERLMAVIEQYMQSFPDVLLELVAEERLPDMHREQVDIVFGVNWPAPDEVVARQIGLTRYVLCASPEYLAQHGTPQTIKALDQHRYIPHLGRNQDTLVIDLKSPTVLKQQPRFTIGSASLMKKAALKHMGIIQLHDYMVKDELDSGRLVEVLADCLKPAIPLYVYYLKPRYVLPKVKQFIALLLATVTSG